jgi:AcrR family transcriptional regulator
MRQKLLTSRTEILLAAAELFASKGYHPTTMQDVAERLSVSKPTLYASFGNKESLLAAIMEDWIASAEKALVTALKAEGGSQERLRALVRGWSHNAVSDRTFYLVFLTEGRNFPSAITDKYKKWSRRALHRIRNCVREGQASKVFRADTNPTVMAFSVVSFINAIPQWFDEGGDLTIDQVASEFITLLEGGLLVPARSAKTAAARRKAKDR